MNIIDSFMIELSKEDDNESISVENNLEDKIEMFQDVEREVDENIIINKLFLYYYETIYKCPVKNINIYSFQYQTFLLFEMEKIYSLNKKILSIRDCFSYCYNNVQNKDISFYCSKCKELHKSDNCKEIIYKLPEIFIIILDRGFGKTFKEDIEMELQLNLNDCIDNKNKDEKRNCIYDIISVVTHSGTSSSKGHYTSCCYADDEELLFQ